MPDPTLIDASDLNQWANRITASSTFPQLLRRLIITTAKVNFISFPSGESTLLGGWDGRLDVAEGNAFVPDGKSVWELGTNKAVKGKADDDYEKRKANPLGYTPAETTFIFVTPRRWGGKDSWVEERNKEGFWKEVRAYDADDLETWLETSSNTHIWLSILLGKHPESAVDISHYWEEWSGVTSPEFSANLVISGRDQTGKQIYEWLQKTPSTLTLQADSKDEAIAFLASTLKMLPEKEGENYIAKSVVVESPAAWRKLIASETSLILIPNFEDRSGVSNAIRHGHHVFIPLDKADAQSSQTIVVPRIHREAARKELTDLGMRKENVDSLATLARRSLLALRRKMAIVPEIQRPEWASPANARTILPFLLAGKWIDTNTADQEILSKLAGTAYTEINKTLARWSNEPDSPLRKIGNTWFLVSKEDAWALIGKFITHEDLNNFEETLLRVFTIEDPSLELSAGERWRANLLGKVIPHSNYLREGLSETLAIMAARSESTSWLDAGTGQDRVNRILQTLFDSANKNGKIWSSIANQLQLLAEASPEKFLEAVDQGLADDKPILQLFSESDRESFLGGNSKHPNLLWALELIAWNPDYLSHAALLLAKLTRLDPGGNLGNRPEATLRGIFLGWYPQTNASLEKRLQVIDLIRQREPDVSWNLMHHLLPEMHSTGHPTAKPQWREWNINSEPEVTYAEIWRLTEEIVNRMIEDVGLSGEKWKSLLGALGQVPKEQHEAILEKLKRIQNDEFTGDDKTIIWQTLRNIISHHREFSDAEWAMPADIIDNLESVYNNFTPENLSDKHAWLFNHQVDLLNPPERKPEEWKIRQENIDEIRRKAAEEIFSHSGITGILEAVNKSVEPQILGSVLGRSDFIEALEYELLDQYLTAPDQKHLAMISGFIFGRFQSKGFDWAKQKFQKKAAGWTPEQRANFLISLSFDQSVWELLESINNPETESSYWTRVSPSYGKDTDFERAVKKLTEYNRPHFAVDFLAIYAHGEKAKISPVLVVELLENLIKITAETGIQWGNIGYDLSVMMSIIRETNTIEESRIASLEWYFFPLLEHHGERPTLLHRELTQNPDFFVELIKLIFRSENKEEELSTGSEGRATQAYRLINSWHTCPGVNGDGILEKEALNNWITKARLELHDSGRGKIGDQQIGQAFAESPVGSDGAFPHEYVRDVIDNLANQEIEKGFEIRVFNNRGVTTRGLTDGGTQERNIAQRYFEYAAKMNDNHPRTAAMLKRIAENYLSQAQREDTSAELTEDFWR